MHDDGVLPIAQTEAGLPQPAAEGSDLRELGRLLLHLLGEWLLWALLLAAIAMALASEPQTMRSWVTPLGMFLTPLVVLGVLRANKTLARHSRVWTWHEFRSPMILLPIFAGVSYRLLATVAVRLIDPIDRILMMRFHVKELFAVDPWAPLGARMVMMVLVTWLLAPIAEEWLFRGVIQGVLVKRMGPVAGITGTAILFTLVHPATLPTTIAIGGLALILGTVAHRRSSLTYAILIHVAYNAITMIPTVWWALDLPKLFSR